MTTLLHAQQTMTYYGFIGEHPITMELTFGEENEEEVSLVEGYYYYNKIGTKIELKGEYWAGLHLVEVGDDTPEHFDTQEESYINEGFVGEWRKNETSDIYPFELYTTKIPDDATQLDYFNVLMDGLKNHKEFDRVPTPIAEVFLASTLDEEMMPYIYTPITLYRYMEVEHETDDFVLITIDSELDEGFDWYVGTILLSIDKTTGEVIDVAIIGEDTIYERHFNHGYNVRFLTTYRLEEHAGHLFIVCDEKCFYSNFNLDMIDEKIIEEEYQDSERSYRYEVLDDGKIELRD